MLWEPIPVPSRNPPVPEGMCPRQMPTHGSDCLDAGQVCGYDGCERRRSVPVAAWQAEEQRRRQRDAEAAAALARRKALAAAPPVLGREEQG